MTPTIYGLLGLAFYHGSRWIEKKLDERKSKK